MTDLRANSSAIRSAGQAIGEAANDLVELGRRAEAGVRQSIQAAGNPTLAAELTNLLDQFRRAHLLTADSLGTLGRQLVMTGNVIDATDQALGEAADEVGRKASASHVVVQVSE